MARGAAASPYALLDIAPGASTQELRKAYRAKVKECHPDRAETLGLDPDEAAARFIAIQSAYDKLLSGIGSARIEDPCEDPKQPDVDASDAGDWGGRFSWELTAEQAQALGAREEALRDTVWFSLRWGSKRWGWVLEGARRDKRPLPPQVAGLAATQAVLLPLLDEVTRRDLRIDRAQMVGDEAEVKRLLAERSIRHRVRDAWLEAKAAEGGGSERAVALREQFEALTREKGDITRDDPPTAKDWAVAEMLATRRLAGTAAPRGPTSLEGSKTKAALPEKSAWPFPF